MKSLFDSTHNQDIIDRINMLSENSNATWGKMNVSQMLTHCQAPLKVAYGELQLKRGLMGMLFGKMVKKKLTNELPFSQNMPTDKHFLVTGTPEFETSRNDLINLVKRFSEKGPSSITTAPHPFFGPLTMQEWDILQWKHLDHHMRQFGV